MTCSECLFVFLVIQQAKRMRRIIVSHLWPVWLYHIFPHYLINGTILVKNVIEHKMCVLIFCITFISNISQSEKNPATYYHKCT